MKPVSGGNAPLSAVLSSMHLTSTSLRGYKSTVDKLYLRVMFQQELAKDFSNHFSYQVSDKDVGLHVQLFNDVNIYKM